MTDWEAVCRCIENAVFNRVRSAGVELRLQRTSGTLGIPQGSEYDTGYYIALSEAHLAITKIIKEAEE